MGGYTSYELGIMGLLDGMIAQLVLYDAALGSTDITALDAFLSGIIS
jgi:hypothetical protein